MLTAGENSIIVDTGATVRVIGAPHMRLVVNRRTLGKPVYVDTAQGRVAITEMGDLQGCSGLMKRCLLMPQSSASLLQVGVVCREEGCGFESKQGSLETAFVQDGQTLLKLGRSEDLILLDPDSKIQKIKRVENNSALAAAIVLLEHELSEEQTVLHLALVLASVNSGHDSLERTSHDGSESVPAFDRVFSCIPCETVYTAYGCTMSSKEMTKHRLGGHSRFSDACPECLRGKFRAKQHFRKLAGSRSPQ
jgi:hypothetical protein